jgi:ubiquinol-cytochrome c reductase cytochrome b subunit
MLPWLDKAESRAWKDRLPVLSGVGLLMAGVVGLTVLAKDEDAKNAGYQANLIVAEKEAHYARELARKGVLPQGGDAVFENDPMAGAVKLFKENCSSCHAIDGVGGSEAPDFADYNSREWLTSLIRNPKDKRYFGGTKHDDEMEPYPLDKVNETQMAELVEYVLSLSGAPPKDLDAAMASKGSKVYDEVLDCKDCHEIEPGKGGTGPNLTGRGSQDWLVSVINDSSQTHLFGGNAKMPKFSQKLNAEQIKQLAGLVHGQSPQGATVAAAGGEEHHEGH